MNFPTTRCLPLVIIAGISLVTPVFAVVSIDYVTIGNGGNAADAATGYGAVANTYKIGTYEVTNAQYGEFLNAKGASNAGGIFNSSMAGYGITQTGSSGSFSYAVTSGFENKPVVFVSWFDTARFTNWLGNGQGSGDMEAGAYTLGGATSGNALAKNPGATVYLPNENEWYKAAFYNSTTSVYSLYPNGQNTITTADANYNYSIGAIADAGSYSGDPSSYGTYDQCGNVWEITDYDALPGIYRGLRGGAWNSNVGNLPATAGYSLAPADDYSFVGFRVASVPEPTSFVLTILAGGAMLIRRKR